ncbi:MAG: iron-sulfur cluster assembly accessory protein [Gammaproteobacteria bacterium]|nr:MAG: iron-sulfur cluster assembly accessory protein [Gammaproteobacteria bacterium]
MFELTLAAGKQIKQSALEGGMEELVLRIAAQRMADGAIDYRMGFDEIGTDDLHLVSQEVDIVIASADKPLLNGTSLDYVELEPGEFHYIFLNPNDPQFRPPDAG